jgi:FixJ family two-component response regulator
MREISAMIAPAASRSSTPPSRDGPALTQSQDVVHVVDDDDAFRTSIGRLLRSVGYSVELYGSADELLTSLPVVGSRGCILLDVRIPGLSGPELQDRLSALGSTLPIIFLTGMADVSTAVRVVKAGADDFLTKPVAKDTLVAAIEGAIDRCRKAGVKDGELRTLSKLVDSLTPRERQVFERVARGQTNKQVGRELGTTERTIKAHRHSLMEKIRATSVAELVLIAERLRISKERPS